MRQLRKLKDLSHFALQARDDEIGKFKEVYFDDESWVVRYLIVHTGGWLIGREVLISPRHIIGLDDEHKNIRVDLTRKQIKKSPLMDTKKPVSRHYEMEYYHYFRWESYWWLEPPIAGPVGPPPARPEPPDEPEDPHLRYSKEVRGYQIHARDGELGSVDDFVIDDHSWQINYLVVDIHKWLPGKKVLIAAAWVRNVDWAMSEIVVELDRETIQSAPAYDPSEIISYDYEVELYSHYGKVMKT
ncbi:MAG: PRC-barrel domain-containing protein [Gammaproteobacteria bacterium]|nr:PRC-barrel domain-containing protein [Gammaproteobacteria bacterium]